MKKLVLLLAALSVFAGDLPDRKLTPGATVSVPLSKLCEKGYASSVRNVPESIKKQAYEEYGITSHRRAPMRSTTSSAWSWADRTS